MTGALRRNYANWKAHPRRWQPGYVLSRIPAVVRNALLGEEAPKPPAPLDPPVEVEYVNQLFDPDFSRSVDQVKEFSCLDVVRLANLWNMVKLAGPGTFIEAGTYRGGTALHLCNAIDVWHPGAPFFCFDPFETGGFQGMIECDRAFKATDFMETEFAAVQRLLAPKTNATAVRGFFPDAAEGHDLGEIAFCHLDVDIYDSTLRSLEFVAQRLSPKGLIVVDDFGHMETPGVEKATLEFVAKNPAFLCLPLFPCQALLLPRSLWPH
jgi:O-methyltransferase